jgi:hypothetical protein
VRTIPDEKGGGPAETRRLYRWEQECERRRKERELRQRVAEQKRTGEWQRAWEASLQKLPPEIRCQLKGGRRSRR